MSSLRSVLAFLVVVNCLFSTAFAQCPVRDWNNWSACDYYTETQLRTRIIDDPANGFPCASQSQTQNCILNCVLSDWTAVEACNQLTGLQKQVKTVVTKPTPHGKQCPRTLPSRVATCPVDCQLSAWVDAGSCELTTGLRAQLRTVTINPLNGGKVCEALTQSVNCPVDCIVSPWVNSGACQSTNLQRQVRTVTQARLNGGLECPALEQDVSCVYQINSWSLVDWSNVRQLYCNGFCGSWGVAQTVSTGDGCGQLDADSYCQIVNNNPNLRAITYAIEGATAAPGICCPSSTYWGQGNSINGCRQTGLKDKAGVLVQVTTNDNLRSSHGTGSVVANVVCG